ncbi:MAG: glutamine synthetase beta-grasp domain-containing protein [Proteobacteria bacterium]|nr:glutamine synthetase beta-grasp domain-containing protein [Pseudomonadota bacterium]
MITQATYIWIDGSQPSQTLRSKVKMLAHPKGEISITDFPEWGFDGSSTYQAIGRDSDLLLNPACFVRDPLLGGDNYLVLCEVMNPDNTPHASNQRAKLRDVMEKYGKAHDPWIGFEQEYTLFKGQQPLGWPDRGYPAPQGPFYCGVGADEVFGRHLVEEHAAACIEAGIMIHGTNAEVMPGQWEFQIGYRGISSETADPLTVCDHLWLARWLLYRIGEDYDINARLHPKPVKGDWNGAGKHTNFSTKGTRDPKNGMAAIHKAIKALEKNHNKHIKVYGADLELRLTGKHETAPIDKFSSGVADRGSSVRIPRSVANQGYGYFEDRRPGANANPYEVAAMLIETVCTD